jgi:hypothetical protein
MYDTYVHTYIGTLAYSSAEKAGARGYDMKDDMWAVIARLG